MLLFLQISNRVLFLYYLVSNLIYLGLLTTALFTSAAHQRRLASLRLQRLRHSPLTPPVSILVPAHNEEKCITASVRSFLSLDYPEIEVIVINDGSTDRTLDELTRAFRLRPSNVLYVAELPSAPVRGVYISRDEPRLLVVDKESSGSKADAANAGLNAATSPYICTVDADSILERDALSRIMAVVLSDPQRVVAAGGIVRVLNGSFIDGGEMHEVRLPRHPLQVLQVIEYLRAFLIGREGWAYFNMLVIISGAFGLFRRDLVRRVGGYRAGSMGEDFDLEIELVNSGRGAAQLIKLEEVVPEGFELMERPATCRLEDSYLNMKGKQLAPLKTEEMKLVLKPRVKGSFTLKPRILYLDEGGKYKSHEPEAINITVSEMGITGWIKGR